MVLDGQKGTKKPDCNFVFPGNTEGGGGNGGLVKDHTFPLSFGALLQLVNDKLSS